MIETQSLQRTDESSCNGTKKSKRRDVRSWQTNVADERRDVVEIMMEET
jgi:hypothetical protein